MTAEIAVLNKGAVALAADSAVTISAGSIEEKIFNTADKLFELSDKNPIGIMIYNDMSFMEAPLPSLIRAFRRESPEFSTLVEAANAFLKYLNEFGKDCNSDLRERHIDRVINPTISKIQTDIGTELQKLIFDEDLLPDELPARSEQALEEIIIDLEQAASKAQPARFYGTESFQLSDKLIEKLQKTVAANLSGLNDANRQRVVEVLKSGLCGDILSPSLTGIVIAGFGSADMFPTLVSFEIDGMICEHLKHVRTNFVDIDRNVDERTGKDKAKVLPFAQREMVDRFLYGLDNESQRDIENFARTTISMIRKKLSGKYDFDDDNDRAAFQMDIKALEDAFVTGLVDNAFKGIQNKSRREIEDMVEFMPKPDLADMAEALVQLTSIKRKVSRGMETVGGPIDVAIISRSEGFVWIKRKHYFPRDINPRYHARLAARGKEQREVGNGA